MVLPSHLAGETHSDPKIRALHQQLRDIDEKIAHNVLDIAPEGQRSPSPEPVYDKMGVRLNTREIRCKERMLETRLSECAGRAGRAGCMRAAMPAHGLTPCAAHARAQT